MANRQPSRISAQPRGTFYPNGQFVPEEEEDFEGINYRWWIMDYGIRREVIQADLGAYLGNNATCRPAQHTDGYGVYLIASQRPLTDAQLESLRDDSSNWATERHRSRNNTYERSRTHQHRQRVQRSQHDSESEGNESSDDTGADDDDNEEPTVQQRPQNQQNQYIRQTYQQPYQQQIQQTSHMQYGEFTLNGFRYYRQADGSLYYLTAENEWAPMPTG